MRFSKAVTVSFGPHEFLRLEVTDAESFEDCNRELIAEAYRIDESIAAKVRRMTGKERS